MEHPRDLIFWIRLGETVSKITKLKTSINARGWKSFLILKINSAIMLKQDPGKISVKNAKTLYMLKQCEKQKSQRLSQKKRWWNKTENIWKYLSQGLRELDYFIQGLWFEIENVSIKTIYISYAVPELGKLMKNLLWDDKWKRASEKWFCGCLQPLDINCYQLINSVTKSQHKRFETRQNSSKNFRQYESFPKQHSNSAICYWF